MNPATRNAMKKKLVLTLTGFFLLNASGAQTYSYALPEYTPAAGNLAQREAFQDMKFGLFVHWGLYSILGDGEWVMHNRNIPYNDYKRLAGFFNPQDFDAEAWVQLAKQTGMKYITVTSRHHDGFSLFKTEASSYNSVDATPYRNDPIKALAAEAQKAGIELHLYYSLLDWGRPDYGYGKKIVNGKPQDADWEKYIAFMKKQLTELITAYPNIRAIWFDGHWERPDAAWHYDEIYSLIHRLNPQILIGNNHHMTPLPGEDFQLFEKDLPGENKTGYSKGAKIANLPLETCETMNNSWGFNINDRNYKSVKQLIHLLVNAAGRNANFLLNVGPMPNGKIQAEFVDTLAAIGKWMKVNGESIYGTRGSAVAPQEWGVVTAKEKRLFAHILNKPSQAFVFIPGVSQAVESVFLLGKTVPLKFKQQAEGIFIYLSDVTLSEVDTVIQLTLK